MLKVKASVTEPEFSTSDPDELRIIANPQFSWESIKASYFQNQNIFMNLCKQKQVGLHFLESNNINK